MTQPTTILRSDGKLHFHPGQQRAWDSTRRFVFVISGSQGGKTCFGPWYLWREISALGSGDYLAVTASYDLFKLKMLPEIRNVFEHACQWGRYWAGDKVMELSEPATGKFWASRSDDPMWARIILRSANAEGGLESATAKAAWLDECGQDDFTLDAWQAVLRRLAIHQGRVLGTTTPYNLGWLKSEVYDRWTAGDKDYDVIQFASIVNPIFPKAEFERAKRTMQDWLFQMFYEGKLVRPGHLIYGCLKDEMVITPFAIPPDWRRIVGVDFGGANQALLWLAENPKTGEWIIYDESIEGGESTREHVKRAKSKLKGVAKFSFYGGASSEGQERHDWAAEGIIIGEPSVTSVEVGISKVTECIKSDKLRVFRSCKRVLDEFGSYKRKMDSAGNITDEISDKRKYHLLDCLRYGIIGASSSFWVMRG